MSTYALRLLCGLSLVAALNTGCSDDDDDDNNGSNGGGVDSGTSADASIRNDASIDAGMTDPAADAATGQLTEPQVVGVAAAINMGEITAGELARMKAVGAGARDYAAMMVTMHTATQARQTALGIAPAPSTPQQTVMSMAATALQNLQGIAAGPSFDMAYIESQVAMHSSALNIIDMVLLPSAKTPALRTELMTARGEVVTHLAEAEMLLSSDAGVP